MEQNNSLDILHQLLVEQYVDLMKKGCEDPRILKEIRELLKDNSITEDLSRSLETLEEAIELPDDYLEGLRVENG